MGNIASTSPYAKHVFDILEARKAKKAPKQNSISASTTCADNHLAKNFSIKLACGFATSASCNTCINCTTSAWDFGLCLMSN